MQCAAMLERGRAEFLAIAEEVGVVGEARLAVVAALDDVLGYAGQVEAG
jgi:hypothetical protein